MNWMSVIGLCLIVLGTVFSFFGTYYSDKQSQGELTSKIQEKNNTIDNINANNAKLIEQNATLLQSNGDVSNTNKSLISQNKDMLDKIGKYQSDIEERNRRIEELQSQIDNVKEYSYYATLDIYGRAFIASNGLSFHSDLSNRMSKILVENGGKVFVKIDKSILPDIDEVIKLYPNFPFGYWAKYNILQAIGDKDWKEYAEKAAKIFEITTTIKGHNPSHDEALKMLKQTLAANH